MAKKNKKKVAKAQSGKTVFAYFSTCCSAPAKKPALTIPPDNRVGRLGSSPKDADETGLGGWRCGKCGKPTKVTRTKTEEPKVAAVVAAAVAATVAAAVAA
jgi:hypothetical protein